MPILLLFTSLLILSVANAYAFAWLNSLAFECATIETGLDWFSPTGQFLLLVIVAPIVETYLFIHLPYEGLAFIGIQNRTVQTICSSLVFASFHFYCWVYACMVFIGALMMNILYQYALRHRHAAFWMVSIFHACYNLYGFLFVLP
ncbi:MAG TPA: CPBP family glutamic-type intramembrane protease [Chryseolinea sp.]|nr:CPBP family glutamic-type intramembrane protease [Chryseolinea sp.]